MSRDAGAISARRNSNDFVALARGRDITIVKSENSSNLVQPHGFLTTNQWHSSDKPVTFCCTALARVDSRCLPRLIFRDSGDASPSDCLREASRLGSPEQSAGACRHAPNLNNAELEMLFRFLNP